MTSTKSISIFTGGDYFDCGRTGQNCLNKGECANNMCVCDLDYDGYNCGLEKGKYTLDHIAATPVKLQDEKYVSPYSNYKCQTQHTYCTIAVYINP